MITLKDGSRVEDPRLGRIPSQDAKSRSFPIRALSASNAKPRSYTWRCNEWFDQGTEGACHKEGTEVLTDRGWLDFRDITETDLLGTVNQTTQKIEYQKPTALQKLDFEGELITSNNRNVVFSVTPDHRMWVRKWDENKRTLSDTYEFTEAKDLGWYSGFMSAPSELSETKLIESVQIGEGKRGRLVNGDDMASFMGIFLAEGCLYHQKDSGNYRIEVAAVKENCRDEVYEIVSSLGFNVCTYEDRYTIYSKPLFEFLEEYYQNGALTKKIPDWLFTAPKRQCELFLDAFCLGDGHTTKCGRRFFYTSSKSLADGIQILFLNLGIRSGVLTRQPKDSCINGRVIKKESCAVSYVVSPWRKSTLSIERRQNVSSEYYKGKVYCATVKNSTLITRYRGTVLISGNCVGFAIGHELAARPAEIKGLNYNTLLKDFYWEAQKIDEWPGGDYPNASPRYAGTSVLAVLKIGKRLGYFEEYRWAFGIDDLIMGLGRNGPAVLGIPWFKSMYSPDSEGFIKPGGQLAGGHAILARAVNVNTEVITLRNSWGKEWGQNGDCYITFRDMEKMLTEEEGEAAFALQRKRKPAFY